MARFRARTRPGKVAAVSYADQAAARIAPTAGTAITAGNGAAGTSVDLTAFKGQFMSFKFPGKTHIRFGPTVAVAAATTDYYLTQDLGEDFLITDATKFVNAWGVGAAHAGVCAPTG